MHEYFNANVVKNYHAALKLEAHRFVRRLIDSPEDFLRHTRQCVLLSRLCGRFLRETRRSVARAPTADFLHSLNPYPPHHFPV